MTAFDLFQQATVQIQYGQKFNAASSLTSAIAQIDRDGVDAYMRADLVALRKSLLGTPLRAAYDVRTAASDAWPDAQQFA